MAEEAGDTYVVGAEDPSEEEQSPLLYEDDAVNLVPIFEAHADGIDALEEIEERVTTDFDDDWRSTEEHRSRRAADWKLFAGELTPKEFPWENCANGHVPIALENISRLSARVFAEIFGGGGPIFGVMPVGPDDEAIAQLLTHHGNWQIREKIPDFIDQQHRGLLMFFLWGDVVCHSTWDVSRQQNHHEMLTCDEFVVPYTYTSTQPDFSDCPHRTRVRYMQKHEIEKYRGIWANIDVTLKRDPSFEDTPDTKFSDSVSEVDTIEKPSNSSAAPYKILEYEGWLQLPNQPRERFCRVILDDHTQNIMLLEIREEPDWQEKIRYERQKAEGEQYRDARIQYDAGKQLTIEAQAALAANEGMLPEQKAEVQAQMAAIPTPEPPSAPVWMKNPEDFNERPQAMRMVPIQMYSHAVCIDNLAGNLGLGIGRIEADLNIAADTALNQFTDAATLANCNSLLVHENVEFQDGELVISPGSVHYVGGLSPGEMANSIVPVPRSPANPQLLDLVGQMEEWGQKAIQSPAVMSGEAGKSGETARGLTARIEQATKQTTVVAGRYARFVTEILKKNGRLNSIFMKDEEFFMVNNHMGDKELLSIGRKAYTPNYAVEILSNLKFTTAGQKQQSATEFLQTVLGVPVLANNPSIQYEAIVQYLKANELEALIPTLGAPPPPPQAFMPPPPPMEEPPAQG